MALGAHVVNKNKTSEVWGGEQGLGESKGGAGSRERASAVEGLSATQGQGQDGT